jgi:hypothetical protein
MSLLRGCISLQAVANRPVACVIPCVRFNHAVSPPVAPLTRPPGSCLFVRFAPHTFNGLANTTATLGSFYWLGFETTGLSPVKKRLAWLGAQRLAQAPLPARANADHGVIVVVRENHRN